jgi:hypothetical protein
MIVDVVDQGTYSSVTCRLQTLHIEGVGCPRKMEVNKELIIFLSSNDIDLMRGHAKKLTSNGWALEGS